ncbi:MAG: hypothetical protein JWP78_412 [Mucilaginibacter sp.]|nr:hypothetical protein [Mucilaginibacter sp.]
MPCFKTSDSKIVIKNQQYILFAYDTTKCSLSQFLFIFLTRPDIAIYFGE